MVLVVLAPSGLNHRLPTWGVRLICGKIPVGCGSIPHLVSLDLSGFIVIFLKLSFPYEALTANLKLGSISVLV